MAYGYKSLFYDGLLMTSFSRKDGFDMFQEYSSEMRECTEWIYDRAEYPSSAVAEFDMVCINSWKRTAAQVE